MTALLSIFWTTVLTIFLSVMPMKADEDGIECMEYCIEVSATCAEAADCIMGCIDGKEDGDDD